MTEKSDEIGDLLLAFSNALERDLGFERSLIGQAMFGIGAALMRQRHSAEATKAILVDMIDKGPRPLGEIRLQ